MIEVDLGHSLREPVHRVARDVLDWNSQGKRSRGAPGGREKGFWRIYNGQRSGQVWRNSKRRVQDRRECEMWVGGLGPDPVVQRLWR